MVSSAWLYLLLESILEKRNKAIKWFLKDVIYLLETFETFEHRKLLIFDKNLEMGHIVEGGRIILFMS